MNPFRSEASCDLSYQAYFLRLGVVSVTPNLQAGEPPLFGCPRLFIQYIRSCPPYLETVSSIRKLRTRHAVVTRNYLTWSMWYISFNSFQPNSVPFVLRSSHPCHLVSFYHLNNIWVHKEWPSLQQCILSAIARTFGSWVWIPLGSLIYVCICSTLCCPL
jgi:hypothetical protein